jgi:hypothetical protein
MTSMPRLPLGPGGMIEIPEDMQDGVSRLVDMSVACRYLAAQCLVCCSSGGIALSQLVPQVRQGNWMEAIEMLGEANPFRDSGMSFPRYQESFLNEHFSVRSKWSSSPKHRRGYQSINATIAYCWPCVK